MGLFSTTHIHQGKTEYVPYCEKVEVTEKHAPTDESVRILNEFQEKAKQNIIDTILIQDNVISAVTIFMRDEIIENRVKWCLRFTLNGTEFNLEGHVDQADYRNEVYKQNIYNNHIRQYLIKKYAEAIAEAFEPLINPL